MLYKKLFKREACEKDPENPSGGSDCGRDPHMRKKIVVFL